MLKTIGRYILSVFLCSLIISISSTQIILASISGFGLGVDFATRVNTTWLDLLGLGPILILLVSGAYLVGFIIAWLLSKVILNRKLWGILAGITAVPSAVLVMNQVVGIEVLFISTKWYGWLVFSISSLVGSLLFLLHNLPHPF